MKRLLLAVITLSAFCVKAEESAQTAQPTEVATARPVEFYVGVSVGHDRMITKRTEKLKNLSEFFFLNNKTQTANGISGKIIAGFLWRVPNTAFVLSPEIYIGQGSAQVTTQKTVFDRDSDQNTKLHSSFKQSSTMGFVLRAGFYLTGDNNFLYGLIGADRSKFENRLTLSSTGALGHTSFFEKRSEFLKSTFFGVGFERKFNTFKVGIDCRYMPYSNWNNYSKHVPITDDILSVRLKPKVVSTSLTFCYLF